MKRVEGTNPPSFTGEGLQDKYMRAQGRALTCLELWAIARGDDFRSEDGSFTSLAKLFGSYTAEEILGPDRLYKMQVLKDCAKHNKIGRNELVGTTRHKDPLLCSINAVATMLLLRFGKGGVVSEGLPQLFDIHNDWPSTMSLFTAEDGTGMLPYHGSGGRQGQSELFHDMRRAAGLEALLGNCITKLRSHGAMHAAEYQAPHAEIERMGR